MRTPSGEFYAPDNIALGRMTGNGPRQVTRMLTELEEKGVLRRTESGTIFCQKMVRDEAQRETWRAAKMSSTDVKKTSAGDKNGRFNSGLKSANSNGINKGVVSFQGSFLADSGPSSSSSPSPSVGLRLSPQSSKPDAEDPTLRVGATTHRKNGTPKKKKASTTAHLIRWDAEQKTFTGERDKLRPKLYERYDDLGSGWVSSTWQSMKEWCEDHPDEIEGKKDHWLFVLGWYSRDAKQVRGRKA